MGIQIVVDYFLNRGHKKIKAVVPRFRKGQNTNCPTLNSEILDKLENDGHITYTPSKSYDDRFIIKAAAIYNAIIISNDNYKDLSKEDPECGKIIKSK